MSRLVNKTKQNIGEDVTGNELEDLQYFQTLKSAKEVHQGALLDEDILRVILFDPPKL